MKRWRKKLKNSSGETLVELLASILIGSLSVGLLAAGIMVSVNINAKAGQMDESFYTALSAAEKREASDIYPKTEGTVSISENGKTIASLKISIYGGEGLYSYEADKSTGPGGGGS